MGTAKIPNQNEYVTEYYWSSLVAKTCKFEFMYHETNINTLITGRQHPFAEKKQKYVNRN